MKTLLVVAGAVVALFLTIAQFGTAGWTKPPILAQQHGFRGTGMDQIQTKSGAAALKAANIAPAYPQIYGPITDPLATPGGAP